MKSNKSYKMIENHQTSKRSSRRKSVTTPDERLLDRIFREANDFVHEGYDAFQERLDKQYQMDMFVMLQKTNPRCKLEKISRRKLGCITTSFIILLLLSLVSTIGFAVLTENVFEGSQVPELAHTVIGLQFAMHAIAQIIDIFMLVSFPQRILVRLLRDEINPLPEQVILIVLILFINLTPQFSIVSLICMGETLLDSLRTDENDHKILWFLEYFSGECETIVNNPYNRFMTVVCLSMFFLSWGTLVHLQSLPHGQTLENGSDSGSESHSESDLSKQDCTLDCQEAGGVVDFEDDLVRKATADTVMNYCNKGKVTFFRFLSFLCTPLKLLVSCCSKRRYSLLIKMSKSLVPGLDPALIICLFIYFVYQLSTIYVFDFVPSFVPVVSLVTIVRVCVDRGEDLPHQIANLSEVGNCNHGEIGFDRAIAVSFTILIEIGLFVVVRNIKKRAKKRIKALPYAGNRSTHLLSNFFGVFNALALFFGLLVSLIIVCSTPIELWIFEVVSTESDTPVPKYDPLHNVGISGVFQISNIFLVFAVWCLVLCYAYLPPDSYGLKGWFVGSNKKDQEAEEKQRQTEQMEDLEHPIYLAKEADFVTLNSLQQNLKGNINHYRLGNRNGIFSERSHETVLNRVNSSLRRSTCENVNTFRRNKNMIEAQLRSNVFVMETEVLLFNFSCATYWTNTNSSREENQQLIGDPKYTLVEVLHEDKTDTHCLIAASEDRIVLAFRGTVSGINVKTDLNFGFAKLPWETVKDSADVAVHAGFLRAYRSVEERIGICVSKLLTASSSRVIMCTGHSLGGGLAVIAAFHLSLQFTSSTISCTTFGCPKVGSYSFSLLYNSKVPTTRRFVNVRDIVPYLPPNNPFSHMAKKGFYHVGIEVAINLDGHMIIGPSHLEKKLLSGFRSYSKAYHFNSRYTLAIAVWCIKTHYGDWHPKWWNQVVINLLKYCENIIEKKDKALVEKLKYHLHSDGIEYTGKNGKRLRNVGVQADPDESSSATDRCATVHAPLLADSVGQEIDKVGSGVESISPAERLKMALDALRIEFQDENQDELKPLLEKIEDISRQTKALTEM